jgi:hypothetical protein
MSQLPVQLRFNDLKSRGIVTNWVTLRHWINKRGFPPGRRVGNTRLWAEPEVATWLSGLPADTKPWNRALAVAPPPVA